MKYQAYAAELVGTFLLTLVVYLSASGTGHFQLPTAVLAGMTVALLVYAFGSISGTHINPAVTIGLASIGKISPIDALVYVVMQLCGGFLAGLLGMKMSGIALLSSPASSLPIFLAEALGTGVLLLGISAVVFKKVSDGASGLVIGMALTLGAHLASLQANGVLNPAVGLGVRSLSVAYIFGPVLGAVIACWGYKLLAKPVLK